MLPSHRSDGMPEARISYRSGEPLGAVQDRLPFLSHGWAVKSLGAEGSCPDRPAGIPSMENLSRSSVTPQLLELSGCGSPVHTPREG